MNPAKKTNQVGKHFNKVKNKLGLLHELSISRNIPIASICLNFVFQDQNIDKIIIGVDNSEILQQNIELVNKFDVKSNMFSEFSDFAVQDIDILFPHHWK